MEVSVRGEGCICQSNWMKGFCVFLLLLFVQYAIAMSVESEARLYQTRLDNLVVF